MRMRHWFFLTIISIAVLFSSFFLFLSSIFSTQGHLPRKGNLAILSLEGVILESSRLCDLIYDLAENRKVKGVILRVDSPGGAVSPSQELYKAVRYLQTQKPVYASMGSLAASGGYYVAAAAKKIFANEGTITGSIGVRMELMNVEELMSLVRLKPLTLKSAPFKDITSSTREMTPEEKKILQGILSQLHGQFIRHIHEARGLAPEIIGKLADGRIYTGQMAVELKLVDEVGTLEDAKRALVHSLNMEGKEKFFYPEPEGEDGWKSFLEGTVERIFLRVFGKMKHVTFNYF